jgi:hypothetical protein
VISNGVTNIGSSVFAGDTGLASVTIPLRLASVELSDYAGRTSRPLMQLTQEGQRVTLFKRFIHKAAVGHCA